MAGFGKTNGPQDPDEDVIVIHLGICPMNNTTASWIPLRRL